jgi:hypothetical protein
MKNVVVTRLLAIVLVLLLATGCAGPKSFLDTTAKFSEAAVKATATTQAILANHENYLRKQYLNDVLFSKDGKTELEFSRLYYSQTNTKDKISFYTRSPIELSQIELMEKACLALQTYASLLQTIAKGDNLDAVQTQSANIYKSVQNSMSILSKFKLMDEKVSAGFKQVSDFAHLLASKLLEVQQEKVLRESIIKADSYIVSIVNDLNENTYKLHEWQNRVLKNALPDYKIFYDKSVLHVERSYWLGHIDASISSWQLGIAQQTSDKTAYEKFLKAHADLVQYAKDKITLAILVHSIETFSQIATEAFSLSQSFK